MMLLCRILLPAEPCHRPSGGTRSHRQRPILEPLAGWASCYSELASHVDIDAVDLAGVGDEQVDKMGGDPPRHLGAPGAQLGAGATPPLAREAHPATKSRKGPKAFGLRGDIARATMAAMDTPQVPRDSEGHEGDHVLDSTIGPFYSPASIAAILGVPLAETMRLIEEREVLGAQLENGLWVCPTWQITNYSVCPRLVSLWRVIATSADAWSALLWICTPNVDLDDQSPLQWTENREPVELAERSAARTASRWAQ